MSSRSRTKSDSRVRKLVTWKGEVREIRPNMLVLRRGGKARRRLGTSPYLCLLFEKKNNPTLGEARVLSFPLCQPEL